MPPQASTDLQNHYVRYTATHVPDTACVAESHTAEAPKPTLSRERLLCAFLFGIDGAHARCYDHGLCSRWSRRTKTRRWVVLLNLKATTCEREDGLRAHPGFRVMGLSRVLDVNRNSIVSRFMDGLMWCI